VKAKKSQKKKKTISSEREKEEKGKENAWKKGEKMDSTGRKTDRKE